MAARLTRPSAGPGSRRPEAERHRADAQLHHERALAVEEGHADHELMNTGPGDGAPDGDGAQADGLAAPADRESGEPSGEPRSR